jgi:RNA-directed DNA polymerase
MQGRRVKSSSTTGEALVLPPLVSYGSLAALRSALHSTVPPEESTKSAIDQLIEAGLPPIPNPSMLGLILGVSPKLITAMAFFPKKYYREFHLAKASGGKRKIRAPRTFLKAVQKFILRSILQTQSLPPYVTGFVRRRNIIQNARMHHRAKYLLNVDLKDFFGSVHSARVVRIFRKIGFSDSMAGVLTRLCTYDDSLPQGAPTSPYLANLAFAQADASITKLSTSLGITYSRYADDMTFSCPKRFPKNFEERVRVIAKRSGFDFNYKKTRYSRPGQSKLVTGFLVNEKVQPPRETRKRIRAMFHRAWADPDTAQARRASLLGWASFVKSYDPELGSRYLKIAKAIPEP